VVTTGSTCFGVECLTDSLFCFDTFSSRLCEKKYYRFIETLFANYHLFCFIFDVYFETKSLEHMWWLFFEVTKTPEGEEAKFEEQMNFCYKNLKSK
jgi:hypothetical protein